MENIPDLTGRVAVVTGANSGIGLAVTGALAARGARVIMACRDVAKAETARSSLPDADRVEVRGLDLADLSRVRSFAAEFEFERLDLLIANAGVMAVDRSVTADGFETHIGVNYLGHFALFQALRARMELTPKARLVAVSSMVHKMARLDTDELFAPRRYRRWNAYAESKLALLLFVLELQDQFTASGATCMAVAAHPGTVRTNLGRVGHSPSNWLISAGLPLVGQPASRGALPILRAATDPEVQGGEFFGPRLVAWGAPVLEAPAPQARDLAGARRLWIRSEELIDERLSD